MRLHHVEHRLKQQHSLMNFIAHAVDNLTKVGSDHVTPQRARVRLTALDETWEKFAVNHEAIDVAVSQLSATDRRIIRGDSYFRENLFSLTQECYLEAVEQMNFYLHEGQDTPPKAGTSQELPAIVRNATVHFRARLPQIDLPKFNGTPSEWLSFKDLFQSLVSSNPALSPVEKLQYLKSSVIGSAAPLLKNTSLIAANFEKAWDSLISFYENKRLLVNEAPHSLMSMRRMTKESATEMESLYTTVTQLYRTLETLQRPVHSWDDFLVFILVERLDPESIKAWEHHLGSSKEPPSWQQFSEFLMTRMLSLRAFENAQPGKSTSQGRKVPAQSHYAGQADEQPRVSKPTSCTICSEDHYTNRCLQYLTKSIQQRLDVVSATQLCYNCLGRHRASACRSTKRCQKCGKKHHTTMHRDQASVTRPAPNGSSPRPEAATPVTDAAKQLHCSIAKGASTSRVLLVTAQVTIISDHGERTVVRALVDQGSEVSLITERVAQLLHLCRQAS